MKANVFFKKTGLTFLLLTVAVLFAFGQNLRPSPYGFTESPLAVEVLMHKMIDGNYLLFVINPNEPNYSHFIMYPNRFEVAWYDNTGKLVSDKVWLISKRGEKYMVVVTDYTLRMNVSTICITPMPYKAIREKPTNFATISKN